MRGVASVNRNALGVEGAGVNGFTASDEGAEEPTLENIWVNAPGPSLLAGGAGAGVGGAICTGGFCAGEVGIP